MGQAFCPPKGNFIFQYLLFRGDFAVGFREGKTFRVIQTMHYYNGNPSRKTIDDSSQNRSPSKFHDHSFSAFFSTIPSIKSSKRILANWSFGTSTTQKNAHGFFLGEDDTYCSWVVAPRNPVCQLTSLRLIWLRLFIPLENKVTEHHPNGGWPWDSFQPSTAVCHRNDSFLVPQNSLGCFSWVMNL